MYYTYTRQFFQANWYTEYFQIIGEGGSSTQDTSATGSSSNTPRVSSTVEYAPVHEYIIPNIASGSDSGQSSPRAFQRLNGTFAGQINSQQISFNTLIDTRGRLLITRDKDSYFSGGGLRLTSSQLQLATDFLRAVTDTGATQLSQTTSLQVQLENEYRNQDFYRRHKHRMQPTYNYSYNADQYSSIYTDEDPEGGIPCMNRDCTHEVCRKYYDDLMFPKCDSNVFDCPYCDMSPSQQAEALEPMQEHSVKIAEELQRIPVRLLSSQGDFSSSAYEDLLPKCSKVRLSSNYNSNGANTPSRAESYALSSDVEVHAVELFCNAKHPRMRYTRSLAACVPGRGGQLDALKTLSVLQRKKNRCSQKSASIGENNDSISTSIELESSPDSSFS